MGQRTELRPCPATWRSDLTHDAEVPLVERSTRRRSRREHRESSFEELSGRKATAQIAFLPAPTEATRDESSTHGGVPYTTAPCFAAHVHILSRVVDAQHISGHYNDRSAVPTVTRPGNRTAA